MRKGRDGEKRPAVDRPNADCCNAARSCQFSYYIGMSWLEMGTGAAQYLLWKAIIWKSIRKIQLVMHHDFENTFCFCQTPLQLVNPTELWLVLVAVDFVFPKEGRRKKEGTPHLQPSF